MATPRQLSFLSRGPLITEEVRRQYAAELRAAQIPNELARFDALSRWVKELADAGQGKETSLEQAFNRTVMVEVLGYTLYPGAAATAWPKAPTRVTGIAGEPDVCLGRFPADDEPTIRAVLELKAPDTQFDAPQARASGQSPVQQAFGYGERILGVQWVLVSDMARIRLYSVESAYEWIDFDLAACVAGGRPTPEFRELYFLLSHDYLVARGEDAPTAQLLLKSLSQQLRIRDSFYEAFYKIRGDLMTALEEACEAAGQTIDREALLTATQRLLDRIVFICYCEDSPQQLLPRDTLRTVTEGARALPGASEFKVYSALKALFDEIDKGSPPANQIRYEGYNGELFKHDPILDEVDLPDALHDRVYKLDENDGGKRVIRGVWGLHEYDFWRELNEHLLGHVFEQSLSDIIELKRGEKLSTEKLAERKKHGIYYTSQILTDFLTEGALMSWLDEAAPITADAEDLLQSQLEARRDRLAQVQIVDLACGSGAFLVSAYQAQLEEFWRLQEAIDALAEDGGGTLFAQQASLSQSRLLRDALHGSDLLPQAVEIAKLALWLRSACKGEKVADLSHNLVAHDSLRVDTLLQALSVGRGGFDLVVGNPPWGGEVEHDVYRAACRFLGVPTEPEWDSWELFLALGLDCLRDGGRLALVLPDTIFSPEKERSRRLLLENTTIERFHNLGIEWFKNVRMGSVVVQARRGTVPLSHDFPAALLTGALRRRAIAGRVPLKQIEAQLARDIPQERCAMSPTFEIELFRSRQDDQVIERILARSHELAELCNRARGEEMSKAGSFWTCPSCLTASVPAKKRKREPGDDDGRRYQTKACPACGHELDEENTGRTELVLDEAPPAERPDVRPLCRRGPDQSAVRGA